MPVSGSTIVQVQFGYDKDRATAERLSGTGVEAASFTTWQHTGDGLDIVAYRELAA